MLQCDVCDSYIIDEICPECGFDNAYQSETTTDEIFLKDIIAYVCEFPHCDVEDILEFFGITKQILYHLIEESK